ncbi:MAG: peptide antibiotic transporter SbmA [Pseudomonadota bacterium]
MFHSFFPQPKLYFGSFAVYSVFCVFLWFFVLINLGSSLSIGGIFGYGFPAELASDADDAAKALFADQKNSADNFWFYQFFLIAIFAFCAFWMRVYRHPWQRWSVAGSALIFFVNWFLVQLDVMINEWFGTFYDLIQKALGTPNSVTEWEVYLQIGTFLQIALIYVFVAVMFRFFVSHYVFRWRKAMNDYYVSRWQELRHIEGASQRVQEDTKRFAQITESLGVNLLDSVMTLIAFLPLLWGLSSQVTVLPVIGEVSQGLVFVAILWSIIGTAIVAAAGIKLPGLEFRNQRVEAAYRKELVYGEDSEERADPPTLAELFDNVRRNYFRLYFHYMYFNVVRIFYLQIGNLVPYIALAPTIASGVITLGVMQQIIRAFGRVEGSFQYLINSWTTIVELLSVYKRLQAFEAVLDGGELPEIDRKYLADDKAPAE